MARKPGSRVRNYDLEPSDNQFGPKAVEPHSTWQLLVEKQRGVTGQAIRTLAARAEIPAGTLFNWIRSKKGAPNRAAYTANLNRRLARALEITPEELADAYNASAFNPVDPDAIESASKPTPKAQETPQASAPDAFQRLLATLKATGRSTFTISELETFIQILSEPEPDPNSQAT